MAGLHGLSDAGYESPANKGGTPFVVMCATDGEMRFIPAAEAVGKPIQPDLLLRFAGFYATAEFIVKEIRLTIA